MIRLIDRKSKIFMFDGCMVYLLKVFSHSSDMNAKFV